MSQSFLVLFFKKEHFLLFAFALLAHAPALSGLYQFDPIALVSGVTEGTWQTNGTLHGLPWLDGNAGVTTEALGALAARDWLHGEVPWWNPYSGVGLPMVAEGQTPAMFLPFVLLLAVPHGLLLLRIVLMTLAGIFTFALLRRMRLDRLPALAGAAFFELNGTFGWLAHGPMMPIAFLPLMLLGLEQARGTRFPFALAAGVAFSFLAGFPETAVLDVLLAAAWGGLRLAQAPRKAAYVLRCGTASLAGLAVAAPAIWPFLEALPRGFVGEHAGLATGALVPASLGQSLFPRLLGNPLSSPGAPASVAGAWSRAGGYLPLSVAVLALSGLRRTGPELALRWVLAGFVGVTAFRAAGMQGAMWLFGLVPLLRQAALHTYIWPSWSLAAAILAALALQDWRQGLRPSVRFAALAGLCMAIAALWLAMPALTWLVSHPPPLYHPMRAVAAGLAVAALPLGLMLGPPERWRQFIGIFAPVAQCCGLSAFWLLAGPHGRAQDAGVLVFLREHFGDSGRGGRVVTFGPLVPNYGAMFGIAELAHNALPVPTAWVDAARSRLQPGSNGVLLYEGDLPRAEFLRERLPAYEAMGATYALTWRGEDLAARFQGATLAYAGKVMSVWHLPAPAAYETAPGCSVRTRDRRAATLDCAAASVLTRLELFDPGWHATVNDRKVAVRQVDIFQSVPVPAGHSDVRFDYAPPGIGAAWAAFAAGIGLLLLAAWPRLARRCFLADDADPYPPQAIFAEEPP